MSAHEGCDICAKLDALTLQVAALVASFDAGKARTQAAASSPSKQPLGAIDLDDEKSNFVIKKDPPRWKGKSYVGKKLSETEPEFLDTLAGFKQWAAQKDRDANDEKKAYWSEMDAARAAGWAARLRAGWKQPSLGLVPDDDVPF